MLFPRDYEYDQWLADNTDELGMVPEESHGEAQPRGIADPGRRDAVGADGHGQ
ncbi:MAG: hypothetical protein ACK550_08105 [Synechococcaceae cyanobacterium]|jgi:hypothetical protein